MESLIAALHDRLQTQQTDLGGSQRSLLRPGDPLDFVNDEQELGFAFPLLLKRLYAEIGNGGFGPGYGLIGLTKGTPDDTGKTAPTLYKLFRGTDPDEPSWNWPEGLLPVCHWGCAILSCIDCADPNFRMRIFDPNVLQGTNWGDAFFEEAVSFEAWIGAWSSGIDLWELMYGDRGHIAQILSARHTAR